MPETQTPSAAPAGNPNAKKILIIEDEHPLAHALELKMSHEGFQTTVCGTGKAGLDEALTDKYDMILLDLILPEIDGFTILQQLRDKGVKAVVIVLSNLGQDEDRKKAQDLGAKNYLVKSNAPLADIVQAVKAIS